MTLTTPELILFCMPLLGYMGGGFEAESRQPVLVFHQEGREIGLAVD